LDEITDSNLKSVDYSSDYYPSDEYNEMPPEPFSPEVEIEEED
jgi:hypothetical protein